MTPNYEPCMRACGHFGPHLTGIPEPVIAERLRIARELERAPSWDGDEAFVMVKDVLAILRQSPERVDSP